MVARPQPPYVQPTLRAILKDALLPVSFWEFLKLALPGGIMMQASPPLPPMLPAAACSRHHVLLAGLHALKAHLE